jgi:glycosyltransferase involved in cell wall biosynthesis
MDSDRPRLLVLTSTFPRWKGDTEPRFVERLSYELAGSFDVVVLAPHCRGSTREETMTRDGRSIEVRRFRYFPEKMETLAYDGGMLSRVRRNPLRLLILPFFLGAQAVAVLRLQRELDIAAVHAHWIVPQGFVTAVLSVLMRRFPPVVVTSHGGDLYALRGSVLRGVKRWVLSRASAVTVVSNAMRDHCEQHGLVPGKAIVRSMGVDLKREFTPGNPDSPREGLVFVGRLVEKKGLEYLLEALAILAPEYPQLALTVVGDGPLRDGLVELANVRGVSDRVNFVGSVVNEEVPAYLRAAAISVMPSVVAASGDQEGLGLVAVEAQGCGCAVVASDLPAVRDAVVDGQSGLMARPGDAAHLAEQIKTLLDNDELRESLAASGRRRAVKKFDWSTVGSSYAAIIGDIIADTR